MSVSTLIITFSVMPWTVGWKQEGQSPACTKLLQLFPKVLCWDMTCSPIWSNLQKMPVRALSLTLLMAYSSDIVKCLDHPESVTSCSLHCCWSSKVGVIGSVGNQPMSRVRQHDQGLRGIDVRLAGVDSEDNHNSEWSSVCQLTGRCSATTGYVQRISDCRETSKVLTAWNHFLFQYKFDTSWLQWIEPRLCSACCRCSPWYQVIWITLCLQDRCVVWRWWW